MDNDSEISLPEFKKVEDTVWEIPTSYKKGMVVPARIIATEKLLKEMDRGVYEQITNVASLPGIQKHAICMPDGHWGYGFPIGGVAAFDYDDGIISPGGVGFDINCGMRLLTTNLTYDDIRPHLKEVVDLLFKRVPAGVGCTGFVKTNRQQFKDVMENGAKWCIEQGYGWEEDIEHIEENGKIKEADSSYVTDKAIKRGIDQIGTLGSGNHYLEIQIAPPENVFDERIAKRMNFHLPNQVAIMVHCGSRGFGHQIGTDYLKIFDEVMPKYGIKVKDKELSCAPFQSKEGQQYYKAMACAANMAFANRQVILHRIRECFSQVFKKTPEEMEMKLVYDVAHNIAKVEEHIIDGKRKKVVMHRKGATRSFGPNSEGIPQAYKDVGQPVILGGSMETGSYLLVGTNKANTETFGTTAHGSGRTMSRTKAKQEVRGDELQKSMEKRGIYVRTTSMSGLAEEAGIAYKPITDVVDALEKAGISKPVVGLKPIGNVKG